MSEAEKMIMAPYRKRIDAIDEELITLLRKRYDVIEEVSEVKLREGLDPVLQHRVDEVRNNAIRMAEEHDLDAPFIGELYAKLIKHSCDLEAIRIAQAKAKKEQST